MTGKRRVILPRMNNEAVTRLARMTFRIKLKDLLFWGMVTGSFLLMIYTVVIRPSASEPQVEIVEGTVLGGYRLRETGGQDLVIPSNGKQLVSFLASECGPCQKQVQALNEVARSNSYQAVIGVFFERPSAVQNFKSAFGANFPCLVDPAGALSAKLKLTTFPQTVELTDGVATRFWLGAKERFE